MSTTNVNINYNAWLPIGARTLTHGLLFVAHAPLLELRSWSNLFGVVFKVLPYLQLEAFKNQSN